LERRGQAEPDAGRPAPYSIAIRGRRVVFTDRVCWSILGVAMAVAAALVLWLNRGGTYYIDELSLFYRSPALGGLADALHPQNGHLIAIPRLEFKLILELLGSGYLPFRLLALAALLATVGFFFALVKSQVGALPALAPAVVLLFFGSDSQHIVIPVGFMILFSTATGLGALLAAMRATRGWDLVACGLLVVSVLTFGAALVYIVAVAVAIALRDDRMRRAWIPAIPVALYAAWWIWALDRPSSGDEQAQLSNLLLVPSYVFESLAAVLAALAGLNYDFSELNPRVRDAAAGVPLAVAAIAALAVRLARGRVPVLLWAGLGIALAYWTLGALVASELRPPGLFRYLLVGAIGVVLVAAGGVRGVRFSRLGLAILFAVAAVSLATNLALLRDGAAAYRAHSAGQRAEFTAFELARGHIDAVYDEGVLRPELAPDPLRAGAYFAAADRYGSPAFSPAELPRLPEATRRLVDQNLARFLGLALVPDPARARRGCLEVEAAAPGATIGFELPPEGAALAADVDEPATLRIGAVAPTASAEVGAVEPGRRALLELPADGPGVTWRAAVDGARAVTVCRLD